jgi:capsular polysaccharide biosynthesis protein
MSVLHAPHSPVEQAPLRICIYAFSATALFFRALIDTCAQAGDSVEWSVIQPQGHFLRTFSDIIPSERRCYLYETFKSFYDASDPNVVARAMASSEGLVTALYKDKAGYRRLNKDEQLRRGGAMDAVYREFLQRTRPDFVLFPDLEVVDGFVLMNLCHELRIGVLYFTSMRFLGRSYFASDPYEMLPSYFGQFAEADSRTARLVITNFRNRQGPDPVSDYPQVLPPKPSLLRRLVTTPWLRWTSERLHATEETLRMRITRNMLRVMTPLRRWRFELLLARYFDIRDTCGSLPDRFVFYAMQYTPESSINGLEPYYVDQSRVIDALLINLPRGHCLVVKEHPAMAGMRSMSFYQDLRRKPGLVLAHPRVDTRRLITQASVVTTVTGTVGLEAYLLGKPCVLFGRNFFSHLCYRAPVVAELRSFLERVIATHVPPTEGQMEEEIAKLINVGGDFLISDPWFSPTVMAQENVQVARACLWRHLARLGVRELASDAAIPNAVTRSL